MGKVRSFDVAEHLDSPEIVAAYFNEALKTNDPSAISVAIRTIVRARGKEAIAANTGLSLQALDDTLDGEASPRFGVVLATLHALGVRLVARREDHIPA